MITRGKDLLPALRKQVIDVARSLGEKGEEVTVALTRDSDSGVRKKASFAYEGLPLYRWEKEEKSRFN